MSLRIGDIEIGRRALVIAEIGSNHNGDFPTARRLVTEAAGAGADAVKFQVYRGERLVSADVPAMSHVRGQHRTQQERFKSLEFDPAQWRELADLARARGVLFLASVFDEASADLMEALMPAFKIASGDLTHTPLLRHVAGKGKPVILSTGMADAEEIAEALAVLPRDRVVLLHCVSRYPTPPEEVNLRAIPFLAQRFAVPVGYSDHTVGGAACIAAVALGATVIEKHFTFDRSQPLGDHKLSAEARELAEIVAAIRLTEQALGRFEKDPGAQERLMRTSLRRSLFTSRAIPAGERLTADCLMAVRPGDGIPPTRVDEVVGRRARTALAAGQKLTEGDLDPE